MFSFWVDPNNPRMHCVFLFDGLSQSELSFSPTNQTFNHHNRKPVFLLLEVSGFHLNSDSFSILDL